MFPIFEMPLVVVTAVTLTFVPLSVAVGVAANALLWRRG